ncbi:MAG: hypothetical protein EZS28_056521, partial [Streblomastix strix]
LVDQKSRLSDPPPAGYAEGNVQIRPFIEAHNRGHRFYIHEYQAFWKEYCYELFKRTLQQSDMRKDSPRSPARRHDNVKNDRRNRRDGKTLLAIFDKRTTDKSPKFHRIIIQRRLGFKPQDYSDKLKDRTQEGISFLLTWAQK